MKTVREYGLHDKLMFGKHRGETIEEVLKSDLTYIEWALEEIEWFGLDEEAGDMLDAYMRDYWEDPKNWDEPRTYGDL